MGDRVKMSVRMVNERLAREIAGAAEHMGLVATCRNNTVDLQFETNSDNCRLVIGLLDQSPVVDKSFNEVTLVLLGKMGRVKAQLTYKQDSHVPDFPLVFSRVGQLEKHEQRLKACTQPIIDYISETFGWKID